MDHSREGQGMFYIYILYYTIKLKALILCSFNYLHFLMKKDCCTKFLFFFFFILCLCMFVARTDL